VRLLLLHVGHCLVHVAMTSSDSLSPVLEPISSPVVIVSHVPVRE
jgi:hypothetical protein